MKFRNMMIVLLGCVAMQGQADVNGYRDDGISGDAGAPIMFASSANTALYGGMLSGVVITQDGEVKEHNHAEHSHFDTKRVDAHAPIGVMGDHIHKKGEIMLSYRYMQMEMEGTRIGNTRVGDNVVRGGGYMVVPTKMKMEMHMFGAMYAVDDKLTMMVMMPYLRNTMSHKAGPVLGAVKFNTATEGFGDMKVGGLYQLYHDDNNVIHANVGVSLPTGSIDEKDTTPLGYVRVPYAMQLGSGTYDLILGVTHQYQDSTWLHGSAGWQALGTVRLGHNSSDYSLGDKFEMSAWYALPVTNEVSVSTRLSYNWWDDIDGADPRFVRGGGGKFLAPTMDPNSRGGERLDVSVGMNVFLKDGVLKGHRFAAEFGVPVYQELDGYQLEVDWMFTLGWQLAF